MHPLLRQRKGDLAKPDFTFRTKKAPHTELMHRTQSSIISTSEPHRALPGGLQQPFGLAGCGSTGLEAELSGIRGAESFAPCFAGAESFAVPFCGARGKTCGGGAPLPSESGSHLLAGSRQEGRHQGCPKPLHSQAHGKATSVSRVFHLSPRSSPLLPIQIKSLKQTPEINVTGETYT